jgi:hypothetical protein
VTSGGDLALINWYNRAGCAAITLVTFNVSGGAKPKRNARQKTNTKPADYSPDDHTPVADGKRLDRTPQCEYQSTDEQGTLPPNSIAHISSSQRRD